jgi:hypothetical protein
MDGTRIPSQLNTTILACMTQSPGTRRNAAQLATRIGAYT